MSAPNQPRPRSVDRTRHRYILVKVRTDPAPDRDAAIRLIGATAPSGLGLWLTRYDGVHGIVRVPRDRADDARAFFEDHLELGFEPLLTSGSIAGLQRKHRGARSLPQNRR